MMQNPFNMFENRCTDLFGKGFQYTPCLQEVPARYNTDQITDQVRKYKDVSHKAAGRSFIFKRLFFNLCVYMHEHT